VDGQFAEDQLGVSPRVIFLDIDGVVAPTRERDRYGDLDPACIEVLNEIVALTGADVVVSSSWRFGKSVAVLQKLLAAHGFEGRVIDKTPTDTRGYTRGEEIAAWLANHTVESFVILDDHRDMGELMSYLVHTQTAKGLQPADANKAVEKLALSILHPGHLTTR